MVTDRRRTPMRALAGGVYDYLYCDADSRTLTPRSRDAPEKTRLAGAAPSAQAVTYETRRACVIGQCPSKWGDMKRRYSDEIAQLIANPKTRRALMNLIVSRAKSRKIGPYIVSRRRYKCA